MRAAVLTVSDGVSAGAREDRSGDVLAELLAGEGYEVERRVVPDERDEIAGGDPRARRARRRSCSRPAAPASRPRDVTPEATPRRRSTGSAPGIAEAIRADSIAKTPHGAALARRRRHRRRDARRQPARLAGRLPRRLRGARGRRSGTRSSCSPASRAGAPADVTRRAVASLPEALRVARQDRAHDLRAAVRLRRRVPRRRRRPERARPRLDHGRDGRRAQRWRWRSTG